MSDINSLEGLRVRIEILNSQTCDIKKGLRDAVHELQQTLAPKNMVKQVVNAVATSGQHNKLIGSVLAIAAGNLGKGILFGRPKSVLGKLSSAGLEIFLTRIISRSVHFQRIVRGVSTLSKSRSSWPLRQ